MYPFVCISCISVCLEVTVKFIKKNGINADQTANKLVASSQVKIKKYFAVTLINHTNKEL